MNLWKRVALTAIALLLGTAIWLPCVRFVFARPETDYYRQDGVPRLARELAARQRRLWTEPESRERELNRMRVTNAEWDFMGRTFLVLALANLSLREPAEAENNLAVMDLIIEETLRLEREKGMYFFLMDYARSNEFVNQPARSLFLDGEIALMLGARRLVRENEEYRGLLRERVQIIERSIRRGPLLAAESYPDECWMFDHAMALAAMRMADTLDGSDHSALIRDWLATARQRLVNVQTGLLVSSYSLDGDVTDGPEGSTIFMVAHCLQLVDAEFAADQYTRAKREMGKQVLGFGFAREWPQSWPGPADVDSGPTVPVVGASAGASGMAVIAASAFGDREFLASPVRSLDLTAFPIRRDGELRYGASNQVGDAALLYALVLGPLWDRVR